MEIREALDAMRAEGDALKGRLRAMIDAELRAFTAKTGMYVNAVAIDFVDCSTVSSKHCEYKLGDMRIEVATD